MKSYEKPTVTIIGSFHELTAVNVTPNKFTSNTPDGTLFHPVKGSPIVETS